MASVEKYTQNAIYAILHHNTRGSATHSNPDIDISKIELSLITGTWMYRF